MNKDLIKKLKDPKQAQPFGVLSAEAQDILEKAGHENRRYFGRDGAFCDDISNTTPPHMTAILKPGYEPEPEYDKLAVEVDNRGILRCDGTWIDCLVRRADFITFFYPITDGIVHLPLHKIATAVREGHKVYARFVKGPK